MLHDNTDGAKKEKERGVSSADQAAQHESIPVAAEQRQEVKRPRPVTSAVQRPQDAFGGDVAPRDGELLDWSTARRRKLGVKAPISQEASLNSDLTRSIPDIWSDIRISFQISSQISGSHSRCRAIDQNIDDCSPRLKHKHDNGDDLLNSLNQQKSVMMFTERCSCMRRYVLARSHARTHAHAHIIPPY